MKRILLTATLLATGLASSLADDVALITLRVGKKAPQEVAIEFYEADAPQTVENFKKLAQKKFYNGLAIHRAFPHILVQMGDPLSKGKDRAKVGTGGPGYTVPPEIHRKHGKGAIAAARLPDNLNPTRVSSGSQFYVCLQPIPSYDGQYTVFGNVIWGLETLDEVSAMPVDSNDNPVERVEIKSVKIIPREQLPLAPSKRPVVVAPAKKWWKLF